MPFKSQRQFRAAMAGFIPGFSKAEARRWANESPPFKDLPDRAPAEKGKATLRSKKAALAPKAAFVAKKVREQFAGTGKNVYDAMKADKDREKRKHASVLTTFCVKIAFALPKPGQSMRPKNVGGFSGVATQNFLKPPGSTQAGVVNPRLSLRSAMTKNLRP